MILRLLGNYSVLMTTQAAKLSLFMNKISLFMISINHQMVWRIHLEQFLSMRNFEILLYIFINQIFLHTSSI